MRKFSALWFQSKHNLSIVYWFHMDQRKMSAALRLLVQPQMFKTFQKNNEMLLINEVCQSYINTEIFKQNKKNLGTDSLLFRNSITNKHPQQWL